MKRKRSPSYDTLQALKYEKVKRRNRGNNDSNDSIENLETEPFLYQEPSGGTSNSEEKDSSRDTLFSKTRKFFDTKIEEEYKYETVPLNFDSTPLKVDDDDDDDDEENKKQLATILRSLLLFTKAPNQVKVQMDQKYLSNEAKEFLSSNTQESLLLDFNSHFLNDKKKSYVENCKVTRMHQTLMMHVTSGKLDYKLAKGTILKVNLLLMFPLRTYNEREDIKNGVVTKVIRCASNYEPLTGDAIRFSIDEVNCDCDCQIIDVALISHEELALHQTRADTILEANWHNFKEPRYHVITFRYDKDLVICMN